MNQFSPVVCPKVVPPLDHDFQPAVLANRDFQRQVVASGQPQRVRIALEQSGGALFHHQTQIFPAGTFQDDANFTHVERLLKFLLWSRGGWRVYFDGPRELARQLAAHFRDSTTGRFDSAMVGERMFDHPIEIVCTDDLPPEQMRSRELGRHLRGCRIGFDLGGSDRKVAAVVDGKVVFSDETVWDPYFQPDPQYHFDGIMDSLRKAAAHLPRVDAIGGSAAGVYVNNRVKVASIFRGVPPDVFEHRVKGLFLEVRRHWNNVPFEVVNDGEVTALAASMSLGLTSVLGISLGTSTAGGYVNREGSLTPWINELAFVPLDLNPAAPRDEWSGDHGVAAQYFSQQSVGRLMPVAGIDTDPNLPLPEKLKLVQQLMVRGDERARRIYETIGDYLGYTVAHFADFYDLRHLLILGRVTTGTGGEVIAQRARNVLEVEFPELAGRIEIHVPSEKAKRHGQAIAAASLPA